jgi:Arc/MetJ family transcription regulator
MRTRVDIDDALLERAMRLTGLRDPAAVLHAGLRALIQREAVRKLVALGGSEPKLRPALRRRVRLD